MKLLNLKSGYSIVEIIIYVAVFAIITIVIVNAFIVLISYFNQTRTNHDLLQNGNTALERMSSEIRIAKSIRDSTSTFGTSLGVLDLDSTDINGIAQTIKFSVSNGALNYSKNGTLIGNILSPNIKVSSLIFNKITTTNGLAIKIEMGLQDTNDKTNLIEKFNNVTSLSK